MARIQELHQRKADLLREAETLAAKDASGTISADELGRYGAILDGVSGAQSEIAKVDASIEREKRLMDARRTMDPIEDANVDTDEERAARSAANKNAKRFNSFGEQLQAIARASRTGAVADQRLLYIGGNGMLAGPTGMGEDIGADGGFLVQTDFQAELLQNMYTSGDVLSRIRRIPISANANGLRMNGVDETSRANGSRWGGIQAFWTPEAGQKTGTKPAFRQIELTLKKLTGLCYATDELLQDTVALESWLNQAFSEEFTFRVEDAIINGGGAGMPLGFLNSGAVISVAAESGQATATIVAENIINMWTRLPVRSRANAVWLINVDTEPQLAKVAFAVKTVAGTENVGGIIPSSISYTPPGANGNAFSTLMGANVIPVEYAATLGTVGDIMLVDLSQYIGIDKGGVQYASSIHARFIFDESVFRFVYRFDGQPIWRTALTPYKGTKTQSPFIVLASR